MPAVEQGGEVQRLEVTSVADDEVVLFEGPVAHRHGGLEPDTAYELGGEQVRTLVRPPGELLCRFATVNDVHFGETECGYIEGIDLGPVLMAHEGDDPYPEVMNRAAVAEILAFDPTLVVAKGDLTSQGTLEEYARFLEVYEGAFGDRLRHVRGNHDVTGGEHFANEAPTLTQLPGVRIAILDTTIFGFSPGQVSADQLDWLDDVGAVAEADGQPVLVLGHHHVWDPGHDSRDEVFFGIQPDDSEKLIATFARRPALKGYFAGHTHRNRVRRFESTGSAPFVEVACVKDFPGAWAEYRVYEGGAIQVHRRISAPEALAWTERTRAMFAGLYPSYSFGELHDRCFTMLW
jgi:3',5'-cyclic AMP phosphodiesterase CpdA